jgi:hypothetical protein
MRDLTRTPLDLSFERKAADEMDGREALPRTPRTLHASTAARWRGWSVSRQARRRNLRLMLLLIDAAPLSRQA